MVLCWTVFVKSHALCMELYESPTCHTRKTLSSDGLTTTGIQVTTQELFFVPMMELQIGLALSYPLTVTLWYFVFDIELLEKNIGIIIVDKITLFSQSEMFCMCMSFVHNFIPFVCISLC